MQGGGGTMQGGGGQVGGRKEEKVGRRTLHPCFLRPPLSYPLRSCITPKCLLTAEMAVLWELCCACIAHAQHFSKFFRNGRIRIRLVGYVFVWLVSYLFSLAYTRISSLCLDKWCDIYLYRKYVPNKKLSRLQTVRSCIRTQFQIDAMCIENVDMKCFVRYLT